MDLQKYAYGASKGSSSRASKPPSYWSGGGGKRKARWDALADDVLQVVLDQLDDRQLAKLAPTDRRTHALAKATIRRKLRLSPSQWHAFQAVLERRESILLMGPPGSGKSFLLRVLQERMRGPLVTASTGAAAEKIGARTFNSAFCLGLGQQTARQIMAKPALFRVQIAECRSIIVDEVSMLSTRILELAEAVIRSTKGGMPQLVACGDPMQLEAVAAKDDGHFYTSKLIKHLQPYILTESHRQGGRSKLLRVLNRARLGEAKPQDVNWLRNHTAPLATMHPKPPQLFCTVRETTEYNAIHLGENPNEEWSYHVTQTGVKTDLANWPLTLPAMLFLKVGARVILLVNLRAGLGLHNGSTGTVTKCDAHSATVAFDNGVTHCVARHTCELVKDEKTIATRTQLPLLVAYAVSVHRAQGATLDRVSVDLKRCFAPGQAYVGLSRVRKVEHMALQGLTIDALNNVNPEALRFYKRAVRRAAKRDAERQEAKRKREAVDVFCGAYDAELNAMTERAERSVTTPHRPRP